MQGEGKGGESAPRVDIRRWVQGGGKVLGELLGLQACSVSTKFSTTRCSPEFITTQCGQNPVPLDVGPNSNAGTILFSIILYCVVN